MSSTNDMLKMLLEGLQAAANKPEEPESWEKSIDYTGNYVNSRLGKSYREQAIELLEKYTTGTTNQMQRYFAQGGIFANDPNIEAPVFNLVIQPRYTLASIIPAIPSNYQNIEFAFLAGYDDSTVTEEDIEGGVCEDCPPVGNDVRIKMSYNLGRLCFSARTGELDAIIRMANRSAAETMQRLFFVGDVRGMTGPMPISESMEQQRDIIKAGVVRREQQKIARQFERHYARLLWVGDTDEVLQNTNPSSQSEDDKWRSFNGLDILVNDDYDNATIHPNITGTNAQKQLLNSLVYDWTDLDTSAGDAILGYTAIYSLLEQMAATLDSRAKRLGYSSVDSVIVMRKYMWDQLTNYLPMEMASLRTKVFTNPEVTFNLNDGAVAMTNLTIRERLIAERSITLNGVSYPVIVDDFITRTVGTADIGEDEIDVISSDIYFLPLRVDNIPVLYWRHADYRDLDTALRSIPSGLEQLHGWHDAGRFLTTLRHDGFCFNMTTKAEFGLELIAPQLAGRIKNVRVVDEYGFGDVAPDYPELVTPPTP